MTLDKKIGAEDIAPRAKMLREAMHVAASVALIDIDENEADALRRVRETAAQKRAKIERALNDIQHASDMKVVRKFWHVREDNLFLHFIGDQTKVGDQS